MAVGRLVLEGMGFGWGWMARCGGRGSFAAGLLLPFWACFAQSEAHLGEGGGGKASFGSAPSPLHGMVRFLVS